MVVIDGHATYLPTCIIDYFSGSTYPKTKSQFDWPEVLKLACVRVVFLPVYVKWYVSEWKWTSGKWRGPRWAELNLGPPPVCMCTTLWVLPTSYILIQRWLSTTSSAIVALLLLVYFFNLMALAVFLSAEIPVDVTVYEVLDRHCWWYFSPPFTVKLLRRKDFTRNRTRGWFCRVKKCEKLRCVPFHSLLPTWRLSVLHATNHAETNTCFLH